jgi:hypothetical protein
VSRRRLFPLLRVGERIILDGQVAEVVRVTPCAAYVRREYAEPREVVLPDGRSFVARSGGGVVAIAVRSAVQRVLERVSG